MKRLLSLLLIMVLLPLAVIAEETDEEDVLLEEIVEELILDDEEPIAESFPEKEYSDSVTSKEPESVDGYGAEGDAPQKDITLDPENSYVDEETGETFILTDEDQQKLDEYLENLPEEEEEGSIDPTSLDLNPNLPGSVINILLIGVDTRSKDPQEIIGRGDTQIIASVNQETGAIKLTSILRDTYVSIPGYRNKTKINNAYQYGCNKIKKGTNKEKMISGATLAMRTINKNFGMNLQYYVSINFNGLASIIDALGGIDIDLTRGEAWYINKYLKEHPPAYDNKPRGERVPLLVQAGIQHLDGVQAVMYARTRSLSGENDFNRTDRQRNLLDLLLKKVLENPDTLMDVMLTAVEYADTNMNLMDMASLAMSLLPVLSQADAGVSLFQQMRIPADDTWRYSTANGSSVVMFKRSANPTKDLHEFIYDGNYYPAK